MFSLRDSANASSSKTDDCFGWWIGIDIQGSKSKQTTIQNPPDSNPLECSTYSDDLSCHHNSSSSSDLENFDCNEECDCSLVREFSCEFYSSLSDRKDGEHIELCSFNSVDHLQECQELRAQCYTPERLVKDEDYRIVAPSPRFYQPSPTDFGLSNAPVGGFQEGRFTKGIDSGKIGAAHLATLLQTLYESTKSAKVEVQRCCCMQYGKVLLHAKHCQRNEAANNESQLFVPIEPQLYSEYGSCCDESVQTEFDCNLTRGSEKPDVIDDSSGVSSVDPITETRTDDWSCVMEESENVLSVKLPRRLSNELVDASSLNYDIDEKNVQRISGVNEVVSILADLENDPNRVTDLLLEEDRFAQSNHDCLARLALAIEPDSIQDTPAKKNYTMKNNDDPETELNVLRSKIERLQGSTKSFFEEIVALRTDFMKDEWKVNRLSEDVSQLRSEVSELRYLDDLLKLLKGELERVSTRNWPFIVGNTKYGTEEINLVV